MKPKLIIRDSLARIDGDKTTTEMPSGGMEILAPDGNVLFKIEMEEQPGEISIWAGAHCRIGKHRFADRFNIVPVVGNVIRIRKEKAE